MTRRYPIEPLLALLRERGIGQTAAGELTGLSGSSMKAALEMGLILKAADRTAQRAGYHPAEVWPSWFDDAIEDAGKRCADCGAPFIASRKDQIYCTRTCTQRVAKRRYEQRLRQTPAGRERNARKAAEWRASLGPAARRAVANQSAERSLRWYRANQEAVNARRAERARERYRTDPAYRQKLIDAEAARRARKREAA